MPRYHPALSRALQRALSRALQMTDRLSRLESSIQTGGLLRSMPRRSEPMLAFSGNAPSRHEILALRDYGRAPDPTIPLGLGATAAGATAAIPAILYGSQWMRDTNRDYLEEEAYYRAMADKKASLDEDIRRFRNGLTPMGDANQRFHIRAPANRIGEDYIYIPRAIVRDDEGYEDEQWRDY